MQLQTTNPYHLNFYKRPRRPALRNADTRAAVHCATRPLLSTGAGLGATRRWGRSGDPRPQLLLLRSLPSRAAGTAHARDLHMRWDIFGQWRQQSGRDTTPHRRYCCRELCSATTPLYLRGLTTSLSAASLGSAADPEGLGVQEVTSRTP